MGLLKKFFSRLTRSNNPDSKRYRWDMAQQICGHHIRYVTERKGDVEEIIGREGGLNIRGDEFLVFSSADVIFRCRVDELRAWELLSKDGVVLTAPDLEHDGIERTITVFYVYYR